MKRYRIWIIALVISATTGVIVLQSGIAPASTPVITVTSTPTIESTNTPTATSTTAPSTYEPCAYMWAYQDVPELTIKIKTAVHAFDPEAKIRAQAYGENCVSADGSATFSAMETDFYIQLPVDSLTDEEAFGNWMAQVLPIIIQIPREEIQGNYGFVEFWFEKNNAEHTIVRVQIQKYIDEAQGRTGAGLFRMFYSAP